MMGLRVLIVDDDVTDALILQRHCARWGMRPIVASGPEQALYRVGVGERFDVVLVAQDLPGMDGVALTKRLQRALTPTECPVILLTSGGSRHADAREDAIFAGCLAKPVKTTHLYIALTEALHVVDVGMRELAATSHESVEPLAVHHPLRILVAEHDPVDQEVAFEILGRLGYRPDVVANGQDAVDAVTALGAAAYDLVFLDVEMPVLDGLRAARDIGRRAGTERPRLVAMASHSSEQDRERSLAAGMDDHLTKPLSEEMVTRVLRETPLKAFVGAGAADDPAEGIVRLRPAARPVGGDLPVFDHEVLDGLVERLGGMDMVRVLVTALEEETPVLFDALHRGLQSRDAREVQGVAHTLRELAATFGMAVVAAQAAALEDMARDGALRTGESDLLDMMEAYEVAHDRLRAWLGLS